MGRWATRISLTRIAYNPDSAEAFGLVWKLAYHFSSQTRPVVQVFSDDDAARQGDWRSYGAPDDAVTRLAFSGVGDVQPLQADGANFTVRLEAIGKRRIDYPRGGPQDEPVYEFSVSRER